MEEVASDDNNSVEKNARKKQRRDTKNKKQKDSYKEMDPEKLNEIRKKKQPMPRYGEVSRE